MAALDFPASPTVGQVFVGGNGVTYTWNGTLWLASGVSAGGDFCAVQTSSFPSITSTATTLILTQVLSGNSPVVYSTSTGRYTPPAGRYAISAGFSAVYSSASTMSLYLRKNGVVLIQDDDNVAAASNRANPKASIIVDANGTDWFDMQGLSTGGTATSVLNMSFAAFPISGIKGPPGDPTPGTLLQTVSYQTGAVATGTTVLPDDDTIPQIGEGNEYMTLAITPRSATSKLIIDVLWNGSHNIASTPALVVALFQDSTANALAAVRVASTQYVGCNIRLTHSMTSGTTSATTFKVRVGASAAGTTTFNGGNSTRNLGGVMASSIVIQEVSP